MLFQDTFENQKLIKEAVFANFSAFLDVSFALYYLFGSLTQIIIVKSASIHLEDFLNELQSKGRYSFTLPQVAEHYQRSKKALHQALFRLQRQNKITSVRRGFYVIIPPEYSSWKILPPLRFIDDLMKFLDKPYYVGLLSSASMQGVSHQQPQVFQVIIGKPALRTILKNGLKIEFFVKSVIPKTGIEKKKTEVGYVNAASAELTALDIILYYKQVGGFSRVLTLLDELAEVMTPEKLLAQAKEVNNLAVIQRLGYLLDIKLGQDKLAAPLFGLAKEKNYKPVPLKPEVSTKRFPLNKKWRVIENSSVHSDLEE
jgi:predicted transcriptional regulator of viral defense system